MNNKQKRYLEKPVGDYIFKFKLDLNPITKEYEPHIWHRHLIDVDEAIEIYFSQIEVEWNAKYERYEGYSKEYNAFIYYMRTKNKIIHVLVISAFKNRSL